jgi:hypothetical protein
MVCDEIVHLSFPCLSGQFTYNIVPNALMLYEPDNIRTLVYIMGNNDRRNLSSEFGLVVRICSGTSKAAYAATLTFAGAGALCGVFHEASAALGRVTSPETGLALFTSLAFPRLLVASVLSLGVLMAASLIGSAAVERRTKSASPNPGA